MEDIKITYKDYEIKYNYNLEAWRLIKNDRDIYSNTSMAKVKAYADKLDKIAFEPFTAWMSLYNRPLSKVTVTSVTEDGYLWVKHADNTRSKKNKNFIYTDNKSNTEKITLFIDLVKQITAIREQIDEIKNSLTKVVIPESK